MTEEEMIALLKDCLPDRQKNDPRVPVEARNWLAYMRWMNIPDKSGQEGEFRSYMAVRHEAGHRSVVAPTWGELREAVGPDVALPDYTEPPMKVLCFHCQKPWTENGPCPKCEAELRIAWSE